MAKDLLKRSQVAREDTWAVEDLYASRELFLEDADKLEQIVKGLQGFTEKYLAESGAHLLEYFQELEKATILLDKGLCYSERSVDVDTGNDQYQLLSGKMMGIYHKFATVTAPVDAWIASVEEEKIQKFYQEAPELARYKVTIDDLRRLKDHTLSPELEELLAASREMGTAVEKSYSLLTDADFENPTIKDETGIDKG